MCQKVAVLLTVHNREVQTLQCLKSLAEASIPLNTKYMIDVFLTDDGCTDATVQKIRERFPYIHISKGDGTLFWNRGMLLSWNTALDTDKYDYFIWLNDDVLLLRNGLETLIQGGMGMPNSIIVGTMWSANDIRTLTYGGYIKPKKIVLPNNDNTLNECLFFNGNCVLIPASISDKIGLLDSFFRHSYADFEYGIRARKFGYRSYVTKIVGCCDRNANYVLWIDKRKSIKQRIKYLYSPLGNNPIEVFYFNYKCYSLIKALTVFAYLHIKLIFGTIDYETIS
jgi:GT2 family glycosyltransferase